MKTNRLKMIIAVILFFTAWQIKGQEPTEFAPIGAEWYNIDGHRFPYTPLFHYVVTGDTIIEDQSAKIITVYLVDSNTIKETLIVKDDHGKVYYLFNDEFHLIYDYTANIGDTLNLTWRYQTQWNKATDSIISSLYKVQNIIDIEMDGQILKEYQIVPLSETDFVPYSYIEKIGNEYEFILTKHKYPETTDIYRRLRCYIESELTIKADWWKEMNLPCDYLLSVNISDVYDQESYCVYPNPFYNSITISLKEKGMLFLKDITGKIVYQSEVQEGDNMIDVPASLSPSIYFVELELKEIKVKPIKIIKK
jgi:hypothetical protein